MTYKEKLNVAYQRYCTGLPMIQIAMELKISLNTLYSESSKGSWKIKRYLKIKNIGGSGHQ
ncbi:MAG: hypothetical protein RSB50_09235 [Cetobacterium sp.]